MGGSSSNTSESNATKKTDYSTTTTTNPYLTSTTSNNGTTTTFQPNSAMSTVNDFVSNNLGSVLNNYLNPSLNSVTNQAKMNAYTKALNEQSKTALENNIINPLANRNMIRSSQATDMYNQLAKNQTESIGDYANELLANDQTNTANIINTLLNAYYQGANLMAGNQALSLNSSSGNGTTTSSGTNTETTDGGWF